jgi:hypothetical protein
MTVREQALAIVETHEALEAAYIAKSAELAAVSAELTTTKAALAECQAQNPSTPSGKPVPTGNLPGWRFLMAEDFNTDVALGAYPGPYAGKVDVYGPPTTSGTYYDTSRDPAYGRPPEKWGEYNARKTITVQGGVLRKHLHTEGVRPYVAALLPQIPNVAKNGYWTYQTYGRYEVCARVANPMPGYKFAWLTWPLTGGNTLNGELDHPEQDFNDLSKVSFFVHHAPSTPSPHQHGGSVACDLRQWHTFTIEWSPNLVVYRIDGKEVFRDTDRIPAQPMRWVLQTETHLSGTAPAVNVADDVEIDWLAMWAYQSA